MGSKEVHNLIVTYTDGTRDRFSFPTQVDKFGASALLAKMLAQAVVSLQLGDRLLVIPTGNIRSVEFYPVPDKLPDVVLQDVKRVAED